LRRIRQDRRELYLYSTNFPLEVAIDGSGEDFKFAPSGGLKDPVSRIAFLQFTVKIANGSITKPVSEPLTEADQLLLAVIGNVGLGYVPHLQRKNIGYFGLIGIILVDGFCRVMLFEDELRKFLISAIAVRFIAASAFRPLASVVTDDPQFSSIGVLFKFEVRPLALTRHRCLISSMAASVTKYLPAMNSASILPEATMRRSAEADTEPSGNAS
jgi:hypothetical protein